MSTAIFDRGCAVDSDSSPDTAARFRAPIKAFPPRVETAVEGLVADAPPRSAAQRYRLAAILGGGA